MLEQSPSQSPKRTPKLPLHQLAKWPPDDEGSSGAAAGAPPAGGFGGAGGFDGGDFKKGKISPILALALVVLVAGAGVAFMTLGAKHDSERLSADQAAEEKKRILMLPKAEQISKWREYGTNEKSRYLLEEALKNLAYAADPQGIELAIKVLSHQEQTLRAQAATALASYGLPAAERAKPALLKALKEGAPESKPQIAWALVELKESAALPDVMTLYRAGHLAKVQRLGGAPAFDPSKLVALMSLDQLAGMYKDESPAVRQLVATVLSRHAEKKYTEQLIALLKDTEGDISRQAAPGLGKIGDAAATGPLVEKLKGADSEARKAYLQALRDGIGTAGLVLALDTVPRDDKTSEWHGTEQIFKMIHTVADPNGGDALTRFIETQPHIHWAFEAAVAMAEVGDLRALPTLSARLRMSEDKIYSGETDYELRLLRENKERVVAARMIADLAQIHPNALDRVRADAEDSVIFWLKERRAPHANGLRALAAMGSTKEIAALRKWGNPEKPLPLGGQQPPFPEEWEIAQSALRYLGWMKDQPSWNVMERMLKRRDPSLDVTMDAMYGGGVAILGMALRAIGVGAAQGFSEWGDNRAFKPLLAYIEEPKENEQARMAACEALAWVATNEDMLTVAQKIGKYSSPDKKDQTIRGCLLETLITRPIPGTSEALLTLLTPESSMEVRHQVARAIGKAGIDERVEAALFEKVKDEALAVDAVLALGLGGKPDTAARALAMLAGQPKATIEELQELWYRSFGYWSHEDLDRGHLFRFVDNAEAMSRVEFGDTPQGWAGEQLKRQFDSLDIDNGPHSFTRVVLRTKLMSLAKGSDEAKRAAAIRTLKFMREQGVLLALREAEGRTGELAAAAYHELMNPLVVLDVKDFKKEDQQ